MPPLFEHVPHPHIHHRQTMKPPTIKDQLPTKTRMDRFNTFVAVEDHGCSGDDVVRLCVCTASALESADSPSRGTCPFHHLDRETFLQLVLLSIIIVGQNVQGAASDERAEATYQDADAVLHTALQIQDHMQAQDVEIEKILSTLHRLFPAI